VRQTIKFRNIKRARIKIREGGSGSETRVSDDKVPRYKGAEDEVQGAFKAVQQGAV
jgi:hypothetical protein